MDFSSGLEFSPLFLVHAILRKCFNSDWWNNKLSEVFQKGPFCFRLWNQLVSHVPKGWMGNSDLGWRFCEIWDVLALKWGQCVTKGTPSLAEYCTNIWVKGINEWIQSGCKTWGWWGGSEKKMDKCRVIWCYWVSLNQSMFIQNQRQ